MDSDHEFTRKALEGLVELYTAWGQSAKAETWRSKLPKRQPTTR
jgi:hypothetical protein